MDKKRVFVVIVIGLLITLALTFIFADFFQITGITGKITETYLEDLKIYECIETGKWDREMGDYKLTQCPDNMPVMKGVGIAVTNDDQTGGRAYCCKADNLELEDCQEESFWEEDTQDYKLTICPADKPIMKAIGIRVKNDNQAGGKVYCCKGKNVELYSCAITSYWRDNNQDYKLTYCPEDRQILGGAGFSIRNNNQYGGKVYCCKGRVRLSSEEEVVEIPVEEEVAVEEEEEEIKEIPKQTEEESFGKLIKKLFCKIIYSKNIEKYEKCVES